MKTNKLYATLLSISLISVYLLTGCGTSDVSDFFEIAHEYADDMNQHQADLSDVERYIVSPKIVESVSYDRYAYRHLDEEAQIVYDQILDAITKHVEEMDLSTLDDKVIDRAYKSVFADYGGLFWVTGYQLKNYRLGDELKKVSILPKYSMSYEERVETQQKIDAAVELLLNDISITASDFEKACFVFDTVVKNTEYDVNSEDNQNIISVFLNGVSVCQGYASAVWYLFDALGIQSTIIPGTGGGEGHAWNLVYLDNAYYYMDATWGDSDYRKQETGIDMPRYAFLAMTTEEIMQSHSADTVFELPECVNIYDNYYVRNARYFDVWDPDSVGLVFYDTLHEEGKKSCDIMFSNGDLYLQAIHYLFDESGIYEYLPGVSSIRYILDVDTRVITVII